MDRGQARQWQSCMCYQGDVAIQQSAFFCNQIRNRGLCENCPTAGFVCGAASGLTSWFLFLVYRVIESLVSCISGLRQGCWCSIYLSIFPSMHYDNFHGCLWYLFCVRHVLPTCEGKLKGFRTTTPHPNPPMAIERGWKKSPKSSTINEIHSVYVQRC